MDAEGDQTPMGMSGDCDKVSPILVPHSLVLSCGVQLVHMCAEEQRS
jgi:hypothetical protein